ncbi:MAG: PKD domain-containing protein [Sphingobacteriales bacterium]|nr:MAG: PKD domain-containing protein [Sphingobacteriales bacterium]
MITCRQLSVWLIGMFLLLSFKSVAQTLSADFTASPVSGCAPIVVHFTDASTGGATIWDWDLGNGTHSSNQNPSTTYLQSGLYTVRLTVSNGSQTNTKTVTNYINAYAAPVLSFRASDSLLSCAPKAVTFTSTVTPGAAGNTQYLWDFGDGVTSTSANPSHTYTGSGTYNVSLVATNSVGCVSSLTKNAYIRTAARPTAGFTISGNTACSLPAQVSFATTSTNAASHTWSFGDGGTSTGASPTHGYAQTGTYTVRQIVSNGVGCADTSIQNVTVTNNQITANFSAPASACVNNPVSFINASVPVPGGVSWDFGDGTSSTALNPSKVFAVPGTYTITLSVSNNGCTSVKAQTITITPLPAVAVMATPITSCNAPLTVSFSGAPAGITYSWNFGDGGTATVASPTHTYTSYGTYNATLTVTTAAGCSATSTPVSIQSAPATLDVSVGGSRCVPAILTFSGTTVPTQAGTSIQWQFGDGTSATTTGPTTHTYTAVGTYTLTATATLPSGCVATHTQTIQVGTKPTGNFTAAPLQVCAGQPVAFSNASSGASTYDWNFGDGGTSTDQNPSYVYGSAGTYSITLYANNNGCADTFIRNNYVTVIGPVAQFSPVINCTNKRAVSFTNTSAHASSYLWDFGDGTTSTATSPAHTYAGYGNYTVQLTAYEGACQSQLIQTVRIYNTDSFFTVSPAVICRGGLVNFNMRNTTGAQLVYWTFGDGGGTNYMLAGGTSHQYTTNGTYDVTLSITDSIGCVETLTRSGLVTVRGATADFGGTPQNPCAPGTVSFVDQSNPNGGAISSRIWTFGDGTGLSGNNSTPSHTYASPGSYTVSLLVIDQYGCRDSMTKPGFIQPLNPIAAFQVPDSIHCTGESISFTSQSVNAASYFWDFGDGTTATIANPSKAYTNPGLYSIRLIVTAPGGCTDTLTKTASLRITSQIAFFTLSDSVASCPPLTVQATPGTTPAGTQYAWSFGNGSTSVNRSPSTIYAYPGTYTIRLVATTPYGCRDSFSRTVQINGPTGTLSYSPVTGCEPLNVQFSVNAQSTNSYTYDFDDGNIFITTSNTAIHSYLRGNARVPKVVLSNGAGCRVAVSGTDSIRINAVTAGFVVSRDTVCLGNAITFTDTSNATFGGITARSWAFGDATTSSASNPVKTYTQAGTYTVRLIAQNGACTDTVIHLITILPTPQLAVSGNGNLCAGASANLLASGAATYQWSPAAGLSCTTCANPVATPVATTTYTVIGTNAEGCSDTSQAILNVYSLPVVDAGLDTTLCSGKSIGLTASGATVYAWQQTAGLSCSTCANPVAAPTTTTTYTVVGTNAAGCHDTDEVTVTVRPKPIVRTGADTALCAGSVLPLQVTGAASYQWTPATGLSCTTCSNPVATPATTTTYTVVGIHANGCSDTDAISIAVNPRPVVGTGPGATICAGSATNLSATGATAYQWTPSAGLSCTTCANPVATPTATTTYTVIGSNASGCSDTDQVTVTINPTVALAVSPNVVRCAGTPATLTASGATTYQWSPSVGLSCTTCASPVATPTATTTYTVIGSNASGCSDTDQVTVTINTQAVLNISPNVIRCAGSPATLTASGTNSYQWTPSAGLSCTTCANPIATPATTTTYTVIGSNGSGCSDTDQVTVTINPAVTLAVSPGVTRCAGTPAMLTASGATNYVWSPATGLSCTTCANLVATPTATTTYTVIGSNASGCSDTDQVTVTVNPAVTLVVSPNVVRCAGTPAALTASGATTYQWSPSAGLSCTTCANPVATPTATTTYTVIGSNASGCSDTDQVTVTVNPAVTLALSPNVVRCAGTPAALTASGATTYQWSPSAGLSCTTCASPVATPTATTTYTVIGSNASGCSDTDQVTVTVNPAVTLVVSPNVVRCAGTSATLTASGATTYQWSPSAGLSCTTCASPIATPTTTTTYTVIGSNASGCSDTDQVTVTINTQAVLTVGAGGIRCAGSPISLSASGTNSYQWSPATGLSCTTCANPIATPAATTTYTVIGSNASGCSDTDQVTVTINPLPIVNAGNNPVICNGTSVQLGASGAVTYVWSPATGLSCATCDNPIATPTTTTIYTVFGTSATGCVASDSMTVHVNPNPVITASSTQTICLGQNTTLNVSGAGTYIWSPSAGLSCTNCANPVAGPVASTTYTVIGSLNGCTDTAAVVVTVNPIPTLAVQPTQATLCQGQSLPLTVSGAATYLWTPGTGLSCTTCANPIATPMATTVYQVTGTTIAGCSTSVQATIVVNPVLRVNARASDTVVCEGNNSQLSATGATNYIWSPSAGLSCTTCANPTAAPATTTTYRVIGSGVASCEDTAYVMITVQPKPILVVSPAAVAVCAGDSVALSASESTAATYNWSPATGLSCTTCANPTAAPDATTTYTIVAMAANGCTNRSTVTVTINPLPVVSAGPDQNICANTPVTLQASGASTYVWSPAAGLSCTTCANPTAVLSTDARYTVTGTDGNGCHATDSIALTILPHGPVSINLPDTICAGSSIQLKATGGTTYQWMPESSLSSATRANTSASPSQTTTYSVVIQQYGCYSDTLSVRITVAPIPVVNAGPDLTIVAGESITLSGSVSDDVVRHFWTTTQYLSCDTCLRPVATPKGPMTYTLHGVNSAGCESADEVALRTRCETGQFFVPNTFTPNGDGQNDLFYPRGKGITKINVFRIYSRWGELMFEATNFDVNDQRMAWDGTHKNIPLKPDTYVWILDGICDTGESMTLKGDVSIIR